MTALSVQIQKQHPGSLKLSVTFDASSGITILFGPSGAGKTTLLDCLAGLVTPDQGKIVIGGRILFDHQKGMDVPVQERKVGYVFQDLALFPQLTAEENIRYGLAALPASEQRVRCDQMMESFRIAHVRARKPGQISGGERQRVALARSLVVDPCLLLLDEPLAALDAGTKSKILEDLRGWNENHKIPILYVTHSREEVFALGERVVTLESGNIIADGTPHEVMTAPRRETVAQLAGFENIFDATVSAIHEDRGTMTCSIGNGIELETPLFRSQVGAKLRVGIRAGDILLAITRPTGLSARNILPGRMISVEQSDWLVVAKVDCGVEMQVHLTLAARDSLDVQAGREVWLVLKTYSCHLMLA